MLIENLFHYFYSRIWNLQQGSYQGSVIGKPKEISLGISELFIFNRFKYVDVEREEVLSWDFKDGPDWVLLEVFVHDLVTHAQVDFWVFEDLQVTAVNHGALVPLINCVVQIQHIGPNQGIITFDNQGQLTELAVIGDGVVNILGLFFVFPVCDDFDFFDWYAVVDNVFPYMLTSFINWSIIDIDNMVICVILHKDWIQVSQIETGVYILVWGDYDAKRELFFFVLDDFVVGIKVLSFSLDELLNSLSFVERIGVKSCNFDLNFASVLNVIGYLQFLYGLQELSLPNTLFGLSVFKYFLKVWVVDHILNRSTKVVVRSLLSVSFWNKLVWDQSKNY